MASVQPSLRQFSACLRCVRRTAGGNGSFNGTAVRLLSSTAAPREEVRAAAPAQPTTSSPAIPEFMQKWGTLDPNRVDTKRDERRILRRDGVHPVGSRRRRAILRRSALRGTPEIPFEQLPYQAFQEARKFLAEDRKEKLQQIETQIQRLNELRAQDAVKSGGIRAKEHRIKSMEKHLDELVILADINDPMVKKKFEDGTGDMNKPIYRYLADQKWRKYKRLVLEQRINQFRLVPDILPALDPIVDIDMGFGRRDVAPGEFVNSRVSETMPRLKVQSFQPGEKLVTVVVVDADVPVPEKDSFTYRCHLIASNIPISPVQSSIPLNRINQADKKANDPAARHIALPWLPPWAHKGAPYHRMAIFVLEQPEGKVLDINKLSQTKRDSFILRSFIDKHGVKPIGATLFRTQWDENMARVMERAGLGDQKDIEFKRKRVDPLPYKRRTERMR